MLGALALSLAQVAPVALEGALDCGTDDGLSAGLGSMDNLTIIGAGVALLVLVLVLGMLLVRRGGGGEPSPPKPKKHAKVERKY